MANNPMNLSHFTATMLAKLPREETQLMFSRPSTWPVSASCYHHYPHKINFLRVDTIYADDDLTKQESYTNTIYFDNGDRLHLRKEDMKIVLDDPHDMDTMKLLWRDHAGNYWEAEKALQGYFEHRKHMNLSHPSVVQPIDLKDLLRPPGPAPQG